MRPEHLLIWLEDFHNLTRNQRLTTVRTNQLFCSLIKGVAAPWADEIPDDAYPPSVLESCCNHFIGEAGMERLQQDVAETRQSPSESVSTYIRKMVQRWHCDITTIPELVDQARREEEAHTLMKELEQRQRTERALLVESEEDDLGQQGKVSPGTHRKSHRVAAPKRRRTSGRGESQGVQQVERRGSVRREIHWARKGEGYEEDSSDPSTDSEETHSELEEHGYRQWGKKSGRGRFRQDSSSSEEGGGKNKGEEHTRGTQHSTWAQGHRSDTERRLVVLENSLLKRESTQQQPRDNVFLTNPQYAYVQTDLPVAQASAPQGAVGMQGSPIYGMPNANGHRTMEPQIGWSAPSCESYPGSNPQPPTTRQPPIQPRPRWSGGGLGYQGRSSRWGSMRCNNCGVMGHAWRNCCSPCRLCGNPVAHSIYDCNKWREQHPIECWARWEQMKRQMDDMESFVPKTPRALEVSPGVLTPTMREAMLGMQNGLQDGCSPKHTNWKQTRVGAPTRNKPAREVGLLGPLLEYKPTHGEILGHHVTPGTVVLAVVNPTLANPSVSDDTMGTPLGGERGSLPGSVGDTEKPTGVTTARKTVTWADLRMDTDTHPMGEKNVVQGRVCIFKDGGSGAALPTIRGRIGGKRVMLTLDTCATISILDEATFRWIQWADGDITREPWCGRIAGIGGRVLAMGRARMKAHICGQKIQHDFVIIQGCPVQALIGLDLLRKVGAELSMAKGRVRCGDWKRDFIDPTNDDGKATLIATMDQHVPPGTTRRLTVESVSPSHAGKRLDDLRVATVGLLNKGAATLVVRAGQPVATAWPVTVEEERMRSAEQADTAQAIPPMLLKLRDPYDEIAPEERVAQLFITTVQTDEAEWKTASITWENLTEGQRAALTQLHNWIMGEGAKVFAVTSLWKPSP
ncbi:hypothetical protein Pelo_17944 [Pelomyxa schiedti]|nr:hypothetical protein Pelo_17944 [Pelomyxa schiedti]